MPESEAELLRDFARAVRAKIERDLESERRASSERRARVLAQVERGLAQARREGLCAEAWLFGSYAWGEPGERSDVGLLVAGARDPDLVAAIIGESCECELHVVQRQRAPEPLVRRALESGRRM